MPYCSLAIQIETKENVIDLLSALAREQFNARAAYKLDERQFFVDDLNDVRAIHQDDGITYGFFVDILEILKEPNASSNYSQNTTILSANGLI